MAIITCCLDDWGGSEELWAKSVPVWQQDVVGEVLLFKNKINRAHPAMAKLAGQKITYYELEPTYSAVQKLGLFTIRRALKITNGTNPPSGFIIC